MAGACLTVTVSPSDAQAAGSTVQADIQTSPEVAAVKVFQIPAGQTWVLMDFYVLASNANHGNPQLRFRKNQVQELTITPPVNSLVVSNSSRPMLPSLGYMGNEQLTIEGILTVAAGSSATDAVMYITVDRQI